MRLIDADAFERAVMFSDDEDLQDVIYRLRDFPTADVPERNVGKWIPVTERLPKEKQDVLLAYKHNMVVGFWENIMGEVTWYANNGDGWFSPAESVDNDGIPLAWMPLSKPYRKETYGGS